MTGMAIPMPAGPGPLPDERPVCVECGWRYTPDPPRTSRARCELCHGLAQDVAKWVQTHPPSRRARRSMARRAWLDLGKGVGAILLVFATLTLLVYGLEFLTRFLGLLF